MSPVLLVAKHELRNAVHPLHEYIAGQIAGQLKDHSVVVVYDPRSEFNLFFREVAGGPTRPALVEVQFGDRQAKLAEFGGSFLEIKMVVEDVTRGDDPDSVLIYVPGVFGDETGSLLLELELAGGVYRPQLKQLARHVLKCRFTDVQIDEIIRPDEVGYEDIAKVASASAGGENASILRGLFDNTSDAIAIIVKWSLDASLDDAIVAKGAVAELRKLVDARTGLSLSGDVPLSRMRAVTQRYVLGSEFLLDAKQAIVALSSITPPKGREQEHSVREIAHRMRVQAAAAYEEIADRVEVELGIADLAIPADSLGAIDTFRIEEVRVVTHCFRLIAGERFADARTIIDARQSSFWVERSAVRTAVWQVCRAMTDLGLVADEVRSTLSKASGNAAEWVARYSSKEGWHRLDRAQRNLETVVRGCEDDIDERALGVARRTYEETCRRMAEGFIKVLEKAGWTVPGVLPQTRIYADAVATRSKPVAYILVDALRYEMGVELAGRLAKTVTELSIRPALGALPSITPVGMAALQPEAATAFSVEERGGKLGAQVDGTFLGDLKARQTFAKARLPASIDLTLDAVLQGTPKALRAKIGDAQIIIVRSQEIDQVGESSMSFARVMMGGVIEDLARCLTRLSNAGIEHAVVAADHGHLFFGQDRDESMRIDAPGGSTVDLHRRCWVGRGGATPPGTVRVSATRLGYSSDLDFVFPIGTGVFKAGGDLAYHHGGASLQELVIPVLTLRLKADKSAANEKSALTVEHENAITNRIFMARIAFAKSLFASSRNIRPVVVSADHQVASVMMSDPARDADGTIRLEPGAMATVGFMLANEDAKSLRIQVLDGETDAVLYQSKDIPVRLGM